MWRIIVSAVVVWMAFSGLAILICGSTWAQANKTESILIGGALGFIGFSIGLCLGQIWDQRHEDKIANEAEKRMRGE